VEQCMGHYEPSTAHQRLLVSQAMG